MYRNCLGLVLLFIKCYLGIKIKIYSNWIIVFTFIVLINI